MKYLIAFDCNCCCCFARCVGRQNALCSWVSTARCGTHLTVCVCECLFGTVTAHCGCICLIELDKEVGDLRNFTLACHSKKNTYNWQLSSRAVIHWKRINSKRRILRVRFYHTLLPLNEVTRSSETCARALLLSHAANAFQITVFFGSLNICLTCSKRFNEQKIYLKSTEKQREMSWKSQRQQTLSLEDCAWDKFEWKQNAQVVVILIITRNRLTICPIYVKFSAVQPPSCTHFTLYTSLRHPFGWINCLNMARIQFPLVHFTAAFHAVACLSLSFLLFFCV